MKKKGSRSRLGSQCRSDTFEGRGGQEDGLKAALRKARPPGTPSQGCLCEGSCAGQGWPGPSSLQPVVVDWSAFMAWSALPAARLWKADHRGALPRLVQRFTPSFQRRFPNSMSKKFFIWSSHFKLLRGFYKQCLFLFT